MSAVLPQQGSASAAPPPVPAGRPWLGIVAVLVGAIATTLTSRLTSSGLADIRGAIGAGFDEGAWITTAFTVAQMLIGPPAVWFGRVLGARNVLLAGTLLYGVAELLIPLAPNLGSVIALQALAGFGSGTFLPLTVGFLILSLPRTLLPYGLAAYAMNIVLGLNVASAVEGWYSEHASWRWIFWQNAVVAVPLFLLYWFGIPRAKPDPALLREGDHWGIFLGGVGFALLYAALDQGDRLDWFGSDTVVALVLAGFVFLGLFLLHESTVRTPFVDLRLLGRQNFFLLALLIIVIRFLVSSSNVLVPNFLTQVRGLRPLEIGEVLLWVALPQLLVGPMAAWLLTKVEGRIIITFGIGLIVCACVLAAQVTSAWAEPDFALPLSLQAVGQIIALTALVTFAAQHITLADALGFGILIQTFRLFGGELGTASLTVFTRKAEQVHSNLIGLHVGAGDPSVLERLSAYGADLGAVSLDSTSAAARAVGVLSGTVRAQAYTLAIADGFWLAATVAVIGILMTLLLRPAPQLVPPLPAPHPATPSPVPTPTAERVVGDAASP